MLRFSARQFVAGLSIRQKLFWLRIGIGLVMGLVIAGASVWIATLVLYGFAEDDLKNTGRLISSQVGQALLDAGHDLKQMARSKEMEKFFHTDRKVVLASLMSRYASEYNHMVLYDYKGRARVEMVQGRIRDDLSEAAAQGPFLKSVNAPNTLIITGVKVDRFLGAPSVWFYYNYLDYFDNPVGVMAGSVTLQALGKHLEKRFATNEDLALVVADKTGMIAFAPARENLGTPVSELFDQPVCAGTLEQGEAFTRQKAYGKTVLVSCHLVPGLMWQIFVLKPASGIYRSLYLLFGLMFGVTVVTVASGEVLSRSLGVRIVEPVERLIRVISNILESGNLTQRVTWASRDEMGTLAGLFNAMLAKIDNEQVALQEKRTRELEQEVSRRKKDQARLRLAIAEAKAATRAKSEFLANMSHEIRTPMNGIIGMSELVLDSNLSPEQEQMVSTISAEAEALLGILNSILDFSKIEAGKMALECIPFNLRTLFEDLAASIALTAVKKGLDFNAYMPPDIPEFLAGDPGRLRQILVNLAGNAVKFTPQGDVFIRIEKIADGADGVTLRFCIEDTGIGIDKAQQAVIFDSFSQADGSTTRKYGGTGLGTTIAKQLVEMMGGSIGFENRPRGGTRFWFTIELQKEVGTCAPDPKPIVPAGTRVLVADTSETAGRCIKGYLEVLGCHPVLARGRQGGLRILSKEEEQSVSLVLLDRRMLDEDDRRIASLLSRGTVPVVYLMPAWDMNSASQDLLSQGAYVLSKPVRLSDLSKIVQAALTQGPPVPARHVLDAGKKRTATDKNIRILLVEDYPANQEVAKRHLTDAGYEVKIAENGAQAVTVFSKQRFDLVLMDIQMPVLDGYEATRQIREREGTRGRVPVIALTAHAVKGYREKCMDAGMDDYLPKPLARQALLRMVEKWTVGRPASPEQQNVKRQRRPESLERQGPVDMAAAMYEFQMDASFYKKVFKVFMGSLAERIEALEQAVYNRDYPGAAIHAHTIKGAAGNVAAKPLFDMAQSLEAACENKDPDRSVQILKAIKEEFDRLKVFGRTLKG